MGYNLKIAVHWWWWWWRRRGEIDICLREIKIWWRGGGGEGAEPTGFGNFSRWYGGRNE